MKWKGIQVWVVWEHLQGADGKMDAKAGGRYHVYNERKPLQMIKIRNSLKAQYLTKALFGYTKPFVFIQAT